MGLPFFWKSKSFPKEEKGLLPAGLAAGVTPTQEWHQESETPAAPGAPTPQYSPLVPLV